MAQYPNNAQIQWPGDSLPDLPPVPRAVVIGVFIIIALGIITIFLVRDGVIPEQRLNYFERLDRRQRQPFHSDDDGQVSC